MSSIGKFEEIQNKTILSIKPIFFFLGGGGGGSMFWFQLPNCNQRTKEQSKWCLNVTYFFNLSINIDKPNDTFYQFPIKVSCVCSFETLGKTILQSTHNLLGFHGEISEKPVNDCKLSFTGKLDFSSAEPLLMRFALSVVL